MIWEPGDDAPPSILHAQPLTTGVPHPLQHKQRFDRYFTEVVPPDARELWAVQKWNEGHLYQAWQTRKFDLVFQDTQHRNAEKA